MNSLFFGVECGRFLGMQESEFYGPVLRGYDQGKFIGNKAPFVSTYPIADPKYYRVEDAAKPTAVAIKRNEYKWSREEKGWVPIDDPHASVKISDHDNKDGTRDVVARRPDGQTWTERLSVSEYGRIISDTEDKYRFIRYIKDRVLELE